MAAPRKPAAGVRATHIEIEGARQHNLKDVSAKLPLHRMTVFCGPSGSGKSSLAIDTLYAEGQRRYVESLSSYARQFLGQMQKPRVERVAGLAPAICIEQKSASKSPRSTVGTVTEVYDYFRVLLARLGEPYCPDCKIPIGTQTGEEIVDKLLVNPDGTRVFLLAPIAREGNEEYDAIFAELKQRGFVRVRVDGKTHELESLPPLDRKRKHKIEAVIDRAVIRANQKSRLADSVETALDLGRGTMAAAFVDDELPETRWRTERYSQHFACDRCKRSFEELSPNNYSFNSPLGWCPACEGLGVQAGAESSAVAIHPSLSLRQGAIAIWPALFSEANAFVKAVAALGRRIGFSLDTPFEKMRPEHRRAILYGTGDEWIPFEKGVKFQYKGIFPALGEAGRVSWVYRQRLADVVGQKACPTCIGARLRDDAAAVRFGGRTIGEWTALPLSECLNEIRRLDLTAECRKIAGELLREIETRLDFVVDVGLHNLPLGRSAPTLSGGEAQRIRLPSQLGSGLTGVLYLLDEPTIGLHPRDNNRLLRALQKLRDLGNTLVVVEHDREVIDAADHLVDFGPGAGSLGGSIVAAGPPREVAKSKKSLTGKFLAGTEAISVPAERRTGNGKLLEIVGAAHHNLKRVDIALPLGMLITVTGVSGSGKSSLINDVLWATLARRLHRAQVSPGIHEEIKGLANVDKVIRVDQSPLGNTPASNPATYTGVFDLFRELYAALPESKIRGYLAARFSFNKPGGRCEACEGAGQRKIEMHFLPDVWVECDACKGKRYTPETLAVKYHGRSISDVLEMTVDEALAEFGAFTRIRRHLQTLADVGLGYMPMGQSAQTLSGGEAQRVKLATELARPNTGKTLYVLDEPTTGLHFDDVRKLLAVFHRLVDLGNTVIVIEHNLDVIKNADWVVDMGPEAGDEGGNIVVAGTPEDAVEYGKKRIGTEPESHTAIALAPILAAGPREARRVHSPYDDIKGDHGDREIEDVGKGVAMPWQVDGPLWHTKERVSRLGRPCRWEGDALAKVVGQIESIEGFSTTDWGDRTTVEISAARKSDGWFFHGLTGEEWLLRLKFRVGKGKFKTEVMDRALKLKPLDEMPEIPRYGRDPRVTVRKLKGPLDEVELTVFRLAEIDSPAFREFVGKAAKTFRETIEKKATADEGELFSGMGSETYHRSREEGFGVGRTPRWSAGVMAKV
ncbi:MAG TPA: excinuclease ABC subunit UvrA, partial [Planctomycetia bacterium]|nr:excinuclease ABC subunit UvrA [Planctomycetia bacterium]